MDGVLINRAEMHDAIDLALWAGEMMFASGAEIDKVQRAINSLLHTFKCETISILVAHNALMVTITRRGLTLTKVRPIAGHGVDFKKVTEVYALAKDVQLHGFDPETVRGSLQRIANEGPTYCSTFSGMAVSIACGAFVVIFGGGPREFLATALAAYTGVMVRFRLTRQRYNVMLVFGICAFLSSLAAIVLGPLVHQPDLVLAASVLYLIPGVPLIDSIEELIRGYVTVGLTRGVMGMLMVIFLAFGMLLALSLKEMF